MLRRSRFLKDMYKSRRNKMIGDRKNSAKGELTIFQTSIKLTNILVMGYTSNRPY